MGNWEETLKNFSCPNCGAPNQQGNERCSNCDWYIASAENPLKRGTAPPSSSSSRTTNITIVSVFVVTPLALCGGCFVLAGGSQPGTALLGLVFWGLAGLVLWSVLRKPKQG